MRKPLAPDLLEWFRAYVEEHAYSRTQWRTGLSPNTISAILRTGTAAAGTAATIEALRAGTLEEPETLATRETAARIHAAGIIAMAAEYFPPDRRRAILDSLGPDVLEDIAVRYGVLSPIPKQDGA